MLIDDIRQKVKVEYSDGAWVEFYTDMLMNTLIKSQTTKDTTLDKITNNLEILVDLIADWNFADKEGKLPITVDSLKRLPIKLLEWLSDQSTKAMGNLEQRKKELPNS